MRNNCFVTLFPKPPTLYLCFLQKLMQFWMVSLLDVSLEPDRVGGSPLSLKQPKFPGTVGRQERRGWKNHLHATRLKMQSASHANC